MKTIIIEGHKWEPLSYKHHADLFYTAIGCGFFTLLLLRGRWSDMAKALTDKIKLLQYTGVM